jgi:Fe-S-cluster containining protein
VSSPETRTHCIRCGTCCETTSPALHAADLDRVRSRALPLRALITLRAGETVWDNVRGALGVLDKEMIKVRQTDTGACVLYDKERRACRVYEHRPVQCRDLMCWDTRAIERRNRTPRLSRKDLLGDAPLLLCLITAHEQRCGYAAVGDTVDRLRKARGRNPEPLLDLLRYDHAFRPFVAEKTGIPLEETDFYFGRPLTDTVTMYGLCVERDAEGAFVLRPLPRPEDRQACRQTPRNAESIRGGSGETF